MKNILISGKVIADKYNQIGEFLDEAWINYFKNKKINLINCSMLTNQLLKKLRISGVILTGGNDLYKIKKDLIKFETQKIASYLILLYQIIFLY